VHHNAQNPPPHPLLRDILGHEDAGEEGVGVCEASENTKIDECTRKDEHTWRDVRMFRVKRGAVMKLVN